MYTTTVHGSCRVQTNQIWFNAQQRRQNMHELCSLTCTNWSNCSSENPSFRYPQTWVSGLKNSRVSRVFGFGETRVTRSGNVLAMMTRVMNVCSQRPLHGQSRRRRKRRGKSRKISKHINARGQTTMMMMKTLLMTFDWWRNWNLERYIIYCCRFWSVIQLNWF